MGAPDDRPGGSSDMRLRIKALLAAGSMLALSAGCEEPKEIIPVAPPGFEITRVPTTPQGEGAQALGEQGAVAAQPKKDVPTPRFVFDSPPTPIGSPVKTASGLTYETMKAGDGRVAKSGDEVLMHYTGTLNDGSKFDSSRDRNEPLPVTLGMGRVIPGWDEGVPGMKVGEKRKLIIPPELGYGQRAQNGIPTNSTLNFEVELMSVK